MFDNCMCLHKDDWDCFVAISSSSGHIDPSLHAACAWLLPSTTPKPSRVDRRFPSLSSPILPDKTSRHAVFDECNQSNQKWSRCGRWELVSSLLASEDSGGYTYPVLDSPPLLDLVSWIAVGASDSTVLHNDKIDKHDNNSISQKM